MSHSVPTSDQVPVAPPTAVPLRTVAHSTDHFGFDSFNVAIVQAHPAVPGWAYLLLALGAAVGLAQFVRSAVPEWLMVTRLAAGLSLIGLVVTVVQTTFDFEIGLHDAGWGLYVAFIAASVLSFVTRVLVSRAKLADRITVRV